MNKIRILVSEDYNLVRHGLITMLENEPDFIIVGECEDGQDLVEKFNRTKPDIVLSDISMPKMNGFEAAKEILLSDANAKIIFLTVFESDENIYKALKIGVRGLITKQSLKGEVVKAVKTVYTGVKYFPGRTEEEIHKIESRFNQYDAASNIFSASLLDDMEKEVLELIAHGLASEEIAEKLSLSKRAVDKFRADIMEKLNLKTFPQLIKYAVEYSYRENEE